jgi:hypothetical protein
MSIASLDYDSVATSDEVLSYRAVHTGAILGLALVVVTATFTMISWGSTPQLIFISLLNGLAGIFCLWSLVRIRSEPDLFTGAPIAMLGLVLSAVFLVAGVGYGSYVYATEVPEGYMRISFNAMKPDELDERGGVAVPPEIAAMDGKKVFIKGYIRPDSVTQRIGIKEFLLVRDNNQCCFGDISAVKYYDQMAVDMTGSHTVDFRDGAVYRMGGILKVEPQNVTRGPLAPVFTLKADYAK